MEHVTSLLLQTLCSLPSKQRPPDQGPNLCSVVYRVSGINSACLRTTTWTWHPHRHTNSVSWIFFQRKYFTHHIRIRQEVQQGSLLPLKRGKNNLKSHNQRQEHRTRALCCSKCHCPMHYCLGRCCSYKSLSPMMEAAQGLWGCDYPLQKSPQALPNVRSAAGSPAWSVDTQHSWIWGA